MSPSSGSRRPMIERISTDLPLPEPPTTPMISPRRTSRSRFSCTTCDPNRLLSPRTLMMGASSTAEDVAVAAVVAAITNPPA